MANLASNYDSCEGDPGSHCWRSGIYPETVLFHGRHRHDFIAHTHETYTVIQVTDGEVAVEVDAAVHHVCAGQLILIGADQVHAARPGTPCGWAMRSLHLPADFFSTLDWSCGEPVHFARPVFSGLEVEHIAFARWHEACEQGHVLQAEEAWDEFETWLRASVERFAPRRPSALSRDVRIEQAREILSHRVFNNESLDEIAEEVGMSSFSLIRGFTKSFGLPPHSWRMQARARAAAGLIRARESLADVADTCGFADQSHLARVFKRVYGVTPGQYRSIH